ncbi:MAG: hypothetical protein IKS36_03075 [Bacteroidales bacterium]|nr:hypothetical protein [Bacteroidales bacterium]
MKRILPFILIIVSFIPFSLSLDPPEGLSYADPFLLFLEQIGMIVGGWYIINSVLKKYSLQTRTRYFNFYLMGLIVSMILLRYLFVEDIPTAMYDAARYYRYTLDVREYGRVMHGLNYFGVVYSYYWLMSLFGFDPLVPLYANYMLTLYAGTLIARMADSKNINNYVWVIFFPDLLQYNMMTSREIFCMVGATICAVKYLELREKRTNAKIAVFAAFFLLMAFVRPPMAAMLVVAIGVHTTLLSNSKHRTRNIALISIMGLLILLGFYFSDNLGSSFNQDFLAERVQTGMAGDVKARGDVREGLTKMLIPHNTFEYFAFGIVRSFAYVLPAPHMVTNFAAQFDPTTLRLEGNLASLAIFFLLPFAYRGLRNYKKLPPHIQFFGITAVVFFFAIGIGLPALINLRYRTVYTQIYLAFSIYCFLHRKYLPFNPGSSRKVGTKSHMA